MKLKTFGECPTLHAQHGIFVEYMDAHTLDDFNKFSKGRFECDVAAFGKCPVADNCPVFKTAPPEIRRK